MKFKKNEALKWHRLDNTANIYPVIANKNLSSAYRISATLNEPVDPVLLQDTVDKVVPWFDLFNVRLRRGVFWYYYETNRKRLKVEPESGYPCRYIDPYSHNQFLFRISYYDRRINLEAFHGLTDGFGAINFFKEIVAAYLRRARPELKGLPDKPASGCHFDMEDSYLKNYKRIPNSSYSRIKAFQIKGRRLTPSRMSIIHGYLKIDTVKAACKKYQASITQYMTAMLIYSIYDNHRPLDFNNKPIRINVPVNLRPYFDSTTTRNFFGVIFPEFHVESNDHTFEEILAAVKQTMERDLTKKHMEELISYNVSREHKLWARMAPLFLKNVAIKGFYALSSGSFTTTLSNLGFISMEPEYDPFIERFHLIIGAAESQPLKVILCSWRDELIVTFSSVFADTGVQKKFFRRLVKDGVSVTVESNGVFE